MRQGLAAKVFGALGRVLIATVDFFTPLIDDARTWGSIAAANAASDVYAMGGRPLFALNIVAWPQGRLPLDLLGEVLAGGEQTAADGGWLVVGGHTVDGPEPLYGQAVIGEATEAELLTNTGGRDGQALVLTKALGTGIVATAVKRLDQAATQPGGRLAPSYRAAVAGMTMLNADAAAATSSSRGFRVRVRPSWRSRSPRRPVSSAMTPLASMPAASMWPWSR